MMEAQNKKWQNLLYKRCPKCGEEMERSKDRGIIFECRYAGCYFLISQRAYAGILMDEDHIMRRFLTGKEKELLERAIAEVNAYN